VHAESAIGAVSFGYPMDHSVMMKKTFRQARSCALLSIFLTPLPGVLEHPEPGGRVERSLEVFGEPAPLPGEDGAFGMGHHCEVPAVRRAKPGNAGGRTVRIERIRFGDL
jgi:hypothetical protein